MAFTFTSSTAVTSTQTLAAGGDLGYVGAAASIVVTSAVAVSMIGTLSRLINLGSIVGIVSATETTYLFNSGSIVGSSFAILQGVTAVTASNSKIVNTGEIIAPNGTCIRTSEAGLDVTNSGVISGDIGIQIVSTDLTSRSELINSGSILAVSSTAISCGGTMRLVNTGTIVGDVNSGGGNDTVDNRFGHIAGDIALGDGLNLFRGGADDEAVSSGTGNDGLNGGGGDDVLRAGAGNDAANGNLGDDVLVGADGNDTLNGGRGVDVVEGNAGIDDLTGGADADLFVFRNVADSPVAAGPDRILDMQRGLDLIDIASLLPGNAAFVGQDAFAGGGTASVRFVKSIGFVTLQADADGNGTADFHVEVYGVTALAKADLIL